MPWPGAQSSCICGVNAALAGVISNVHPCTEWMKELGKQGSHNQLKSLHSGTVPVIFAMMCP